LRGSQEAGYGSGSLPVSVIHIKPPIFQEAGVQCQSQQTLFAAAAPHPVAQVQEGYRLDQSIFEKLNDAPLLHQKNAPIPGIRQVHRLGQSICNNSPGVT